MAEPSEKPQEDSTSLSERVLAYCNEVQALIGQGVEHPHYEFKRAYSISRENLNDRLDFIKLVQGLANADLAGERFIIVGGDPKERKFFPVSNIDEFDEATLSSVLSKYLDPIPRLQVFNNLQTSEGHTFVLLVLAGTQPRPILVKKEGQRTDGKTRLQVGEIWIKKNTSLQLATRYDIDQMYKQKIEEEAEDRARKRFKHYGELAADSLTASRTAHRLPVREMLVEPEGRFRRFVEELIVENDSARFRMLMELLRETFVEGWDLLEMDNSNSAIPARQRVEQIEGFFRDEFLPSLQSLVALGLLIIKYECPLDWLALVVDTLMDAFESVRHLQPLKSTYAAQRPDNLEWWQPGFEIFLGFRCLATYAVSRKKLGFLETLLPRFTERLEIDDRQELNTPMLFWPLPGNLFEDGSLNEGRSTFFWNQRISTSWGKYFGNYNKFISASCQLEFLIEFNSFLGTNSLGNLKLESWLESNANKRSYWYNPDLFAYSLSLTVPMAELCYDQIRSTDLFPAYLSVTPALFNSVFSNIQTDQRLLILGQFLNHLNKFQSRYNGPPYFRFAFGSSWSGRLAEIVNKYRAQAAAQSM